MGIEIIGGGGLNLGPRRVGLQAGGGGWTPVAQPAGFTRVLPFTIEQSGRRFRAIDNTTHQVFDPATYKPAISKAYYVDIATGDDAATGADFAHALKSINVALAKADVDAVYVQAGLYPAGNGWYPANQNRSVSVIAVGGTVIISEHRADLSWSASDDHYVAAHGGADTAVYAVRDAAHLDANGDYSLLTKVADEATCDSTAGSWAIDATNVYLHLSDARVPDSDVRPYKFVASHWAGRVRNANTFYIENCEFHGGGGGGLFMTTSPGPLSPTLYMKGGAIKYANGNGLVGTSVSYLQDVVVSGNLDDGLNYHLANTAIAQAVEIDCVCRDNGLAGDIDNGSTIHDGSNIVRISGEYARNVGRNLHDISSATLSWNLGCIVHDSASAVNDYNIASGSAVGDTTEMWCDSVTSYGSATDFEVTAAAKIHLRNVISGGTNIGDGTIDDY